MPRYYFHLKSPSRPVRDKTGVELPGLEAGDATLVLLPRAVPMLREPTAPPRHLISSSSPLGGATQGPR
jgi:hypothetical protein